jgi:hypothetical protein
MILEVFSFLTTSTIALLQYHTGEISFEEFVDMMRSSEMSTDYEQEM